MNEPKLSTPQPVRRGVTAGHLILLFGVAQVAIIYGLLAFETPVSALARRAAASWGGRIALAGIGWGLLSAFMFVALTIAERRAARRKTEAEV